MAGVVIVGESEDSNFAIQEVAAGSDPFPEVGGAVDNRFIPNLADGLDARAVAEPSDVGEVRCESVSLDEIFVWMWHPGMIDQGERDTVFVKQVKKGRADPIFVADFQGEARLCREFLKKYFQAGEKLYGCGKSFFIE